jgi:hypothetical protein
VNEITIFDQPTEGGFVRRESGRLDRMGGSGITSRRIKISNARVFKKVVNGEEIGKAVDKQLDVIIVDWLTDPSRKFYAGAYDKNAKATLPDCWSNDGVTPESSAKAPQAKSCMECPKNVKGSGQNGQGKACRYERRLAVLVAGDLSGDVYQITVPGGSLFSNNEGNRYGFEGYKKFLLANNAAPDTVVTSLIYDLETDTAKLWFKAASYLTQPQAAAVDVAQKDPATDRYLKLTAAAVDGAKAIAAPEPVAAIAPATASVNPFGDDDDADEEEAPVKRAAKKETPAAPKAELNEVLGDWLEDDED